MAVHPQTQIPSWVKDYHKEFYDSITAKEYWCYTNIFTLPPPPPNPLPEGYVPGPSYDQPGLYWYKILFKQLADTMNAWKNTNYQSIGIDLVTLTSGLYSSAKLFKMADVPNPFPNGQSVQDILSACDAYVLLNMAEFIPHTLSRPENFYNDIDSGGESALMADDIASLNGGTDLGKCEAMKPILYLAMKTLGAKGSFEVPSGAAPSNAEKSQKIFTEMHYDKVYIHLNIHTIVHSNLPPSISTTPVFDLRTQTE